MNVEKKINHAELSIILKKHFENAESTDLSKFTVTQNSDGNHVVSYETGLIKPTMTEQLAGEVTKAKTVFKSIFGRS